MRRQVLLSALGMVAFLAALGALMRFDWPQMLQPAPLLAVMLGTLLLTAAQYRKGDGWVDLAHKARWNSFFAGAMTVLLTLLSLATPAQAQAITVAKTAQAITPLLLSSMLYLILSLLLRQEARSRQDGGAAQADPAEPLNPDKARIILSSRGFSQRECHVAIKVLQGSSNKEIAAQLYISEATVKKHIQNMFRKCGAADRQAFLAIYLQWTSRTKATRSERQPPAVNFATKSAGGGRRSLCEQTPSLAQDIPDQQIDPQTRKQHNRADGLSQEKAMG